MLLLPLSLLVTLPQSDRPVFRPPEEEGKTAEEQALEEMRARAERRRAWDTERSLRLSASLDGGLALFESGSAFVYRASLALEKRASRVATFGVSIFGVVGLHSEPQVLAGNRDSDSLLLGAGAQAMVRFGRDRWFFGIGGFGQGAWILGDPVEADPARFLLGFAGEGGVRFGPQREATVFGWIRTGVDVETALSDHHLVYMAGTGFRGDLLIW